MEPNDYASCPVDVDAVCAMECRPDIECPESQKCCGGCCRDIVNLPYYDIPRDCPDNFVSLSSDSDACDVECQSDTHCSDSKLCCRGDSCSSSCQEGVRPLDPCHAVKDLLEDGEASLGRYVPQCTDDGLFRTVQVRENYRWCVHALTGKPISDAVNASDDTSICPCESILLKSILCA